MLPFRFPGFLLVLFVSFGGLSAVSAAPGDPALIPPRINMHPGPEYADNVRMFQGIPTLEHAPNGRLWAAGMVAVLPKIATTSSCW